MSHRNRFTLCNAGHPRPLWYRSNFGLWSYINDDIVDTGSAFNLPLGFDASGAYQQVGLNIADGDILIFYTDALIEARNGDGALLGENELLRIVAGLPTAIIPISLRPRQRAEPSVAQRRASRCVTSAAL